MKPCHSIPSILFVFLFFMISGCNNSDSEKTGNHLAETPRLTGTWQQTDIGEQKVTDVVVKIIFSEQTLTMDAPGCMIIGSYTTAEDVLTYRVTSTQGERCSESLTIGTSDRVHFAVTDTQLTLTPLSGGKESQARYRRIGH